MKTSVLLALKYPEHGDPLGDECARLGLAREIFPWALAAGGALPVALTADERRRWREIYDGMIEHPRSGVEAALLNRRLYLNAPDVAKRRMLLGALRWYRESAKLRLLAEDKRLATRALHNTEASYHSYFPREPEDRL